MVAGAPAPSMGTNCTFFVVVPHDPFGRYALTLGPWTRSDWELAGTQAPTCARLRTTSNGVLVTLRPSLEAIRVSAVPVRLTLRSGNVATPFTAFCVRVPLKTADAALALREMVTGPFAAVSTWPVASSNVTCTAGAKC